MLLNLIIFTFHIIFYSFHYSILFIGAITLFSLQDLYQKISALKKIPQEKLILFSESCQFCVTPWTKDSYDLSDLVGSEENEEVSHSRV